MILALAQLNHPGYTPALWQGTMVYWGVMSVAILINTTTSKMLPKLESFILVLHILGFFAILIPLVYVGSWRTRTLKSVTEVVQLDGSTESFCSRSLHGL